MFRSGAHGTTALRGLCGARSGVRSVAGSFAVRSARCDHRPARGSESLCGCDAGRLRGRDAELLVGKRRDARWCRLVSVRFRSFRFGCAPYGKRDESAMFAVYSVNTCTDEDSGAHHRGRQRRVSSAERTRAASALIPFRASWLKAGRGKRGRFSRPWRAVLRYQGE